MKKALILTLNDEELLELYYILADRDGDAAIEFLNTHLRKQITQALEGG
jgi:hypothetical protein